ncbi:hypothetical protein MAELSTROM_15 [Pseudoalteromonas phage Maelstrom]|uniref:hypothetical protein n=1 Tax=Pseudoalteromonas phage Maelstrom TaxID=2065202 RepID=UPI000CA29611|nr:hypothetical protein PP584_gp15 [Pseudoalteromonas phage Maelstrom]AUG84935.1 hypothetical protein MAELSTROM_15 [Pseudoalteromonas phage Maelstrom]
MTTLSNMIIELDRDIRNDCIINRTVQTFLYVTHEKAKEMEDLLLRAHGSSDITRESVQSLFHRLRTDSDVTTHDGMHSLLMGLSGNE